MSHSVKPGSRGPCGPGNKLGWAQKRLGRAPISGPLTSFEHWPIYLVDAPAMSDNLISWQRHECSKHKLQTQINHSVHEVIVTGCFDNSPKRYYSLINLVGGLTVRRNALVRSYSHSRRTRRLHQSYVGYVARYCSRRQLGLLDLRLYDTTRALEDRRPPPRRIRIQIRMISRIWWRKLYCPKIHLWKNPRKDPIIFFRRDEPNRGKTPYRAV